MLRYFVIFLCCASIYYLGFLGFKLFTDVSVLEKAYPKVVYNPKEKNATVEITKKRPASWVNLGAISPIAVSAFVISEDWSFYQHNGFDWEQIWESFQENLKKGKFARGGSTITQQVVKNVFLSSEKTIYRKVLEAILAMRLERQLTKKKILEVYLNIVELGPGIYGIGAASHHYFGKSAGQLTAKEGAFLAMLLPSPKKYSVSFRRQELTPYASSTVRSILSKLMATGRISQEQYQAYNQTPLSFEKTYAPPQAEAPMDEEVDDGQSEIVEEGVTNWEPSVVKPEEAIAE